MNRQDWNLIVLAAAEGKGLTPAQLQKVLFLIQERLPGAMPAGYSFRPYNYGPFDADVYTDAEELERQGLVNIIRSGNGWRTYSASPAGMRQAREVSQNADPRSVAYAKQVVDWARSISFRDLVTSIYKEFPHMKAKSIFRE